MVGECRKHQCDMADYLNQGVCKNRKNQVTLEP